MSKMADAHWEMQEEASERAWEEEQYHKWTLEGCIKDMERDVERGSALIQILNAEKAKRNEQETNSNEIPS